MGGSTGRDKLVCSTENKDGGQWEMMPREALRKEQGEKGLGKETQRECLKRWRKVKERVWTW